MKNAVLILVTLFTMMTQAQEQKLNPTPQISVTGEGKIKVTPDQAILTAGVQNSGKDAAEVKKLNDITIDRVIKFLKKNGIATTDFISSNISLDKQYNYENKKNTFLANQTLIITLKDLSKYDELMMGLNETGINSIQGVEFKSSKIEDYERECRKKAILNAKQKATDYTSVIGQKVGKALFISDVSSTVYPQPMYKNVMMTAMDAESDTARETIAIGEIEIVSFVTVSFILD